MATSGTFYFQDVESVELITEAYARAGLPAPQKPVEQNKEAQRAINLILYSWINRGINLWTLKKEMMALVPGKVTYALPTNTSDVMFVTLRQSVRNLGGTAYSSAGGVAQNAFDGNSSTACTQTVPNGNISYNWGSNTTISMVGIQSNVTRVYTLVFEYSTDNVNWYEAGSAEVACTLGELQWVVMDIPTPATWFRARETAGATLNIQELYFNSIQQDLILSRMSWADWISLNNKTQYPNKPNQYLIDRQRRPLITLWPAPAPTYNAIFYLRIEMPEDIGTLKQTPAIPGRFFEALVSSLAHILAIKGNQPMDKCQYLKSLADKEFELAKIEDREKVNTTIVGDPSGRRIA